MRKLIVCTIAVALLGQPSGAFGFKWRNVPVQGERTGVTTPNVNNIDEALGTFDGNTYIAPNGSRFKKRSATARVARLMIEAQPALAYLKEVVGYCPEGLTRRGTESALGDWVVDCVMVETEKEVGRKVDIGIMNHGGIRIDMPKGDVLKDDIMSMLPFKNHLCYLTMSGENVLALFNSMADHMQPVGGVKVTVKDGKVQQLLIGGEPVDVSRTYGIATIDFLLDGGDDIFVARNSESLIQSEILVYDAAMNYLNDLKAAGKNIEKKIDNRVVEL